jgi:hypothetical protein
MNTQIKGFGGQYRFLSNFYPCVLQLDGLEFPTLEHAYQASKVVVLPSRKLFQHGTPGQAKRLGNGITLRPDWEEVKIDVMLSLLRQKFAQEPLKQMLLETGDAYLEETNSWGDIFWGVYNEMGQNWLGKLLMQVREELQ